MIIIAWSSLDWCVNLCLSDMGSSVLSRRFQPDSMHLVYIHFLIYTLLLCLYIMHINYHVLSPAYVPKRTEWWALQFINPPMTELFKKLWILLVGPFTILYTKRKKRGLNYLPQNLNIRSHYWVGLRNKPSQLKTNT